MKKELHPKYQEVLFVDSTTGYKFVCGSTLQPDAKQTHNGKEYPVYHLSTSSASHPLFTGSNQLVDSEKRVDKFRKRYAAKPEVAKEEAPVAASKSSATKGASAKGASKKGA